ncbi:putative sperm-associated antigen 16 protein [Apostichopus japonicus]|uniref:Putative sperm-associated antigen 16 protein n=1 Tax=Stichopus japonicus TaxID=307972 RepID=A0A2G8JSM6_STIJA|nr:putative sperm-associated antigen 16 protein [Apostichopus japonicus]
MIISMRQHLSETKSLPAVTQRPEVVDDFVRNFLVKMGMMRTLDSFQTEWYELQERGELNREDVTTVPDVYTRNQQLDSLVKTMRSDLQKFKNAANKAKDTYVKLRKERDFHRMHHKRVVQEKNKLIEDIKRLKRHYASYEPTLTQLKQKYESAMKEKMLSKLERDRAVNQVAGLQATLRNLETATMFNSQNMTREERRLMYASGEGPTQSAVKTAKEGSSCRYEVDPSNLDVTNQELPRHPKDSDFPIDTRVNPDLADVKGPSSHLTRTGGFRLTHTIQAHTLAVSSVALHPKKQILATTSDDQTWKMWSIPNGDIIMTGEGHTDWVADCDFRPDGAQLVTGSGDSTVKIWDFSKAECVHTFTDHQHADSVNSIHFLPYSNTILTSSADKTVSLWDARTGLCGQTFYGHIHSVNHAAFNLKGDVVASCDSYGVVKLWDNRTCAAISSVEIGPHPTNRVAFDSSGTVLSIASNDGTVKILDLGSGQITILDGHEDSVQAVLFDKAGDFLVSGSSDNTVRIWS